MPINYDEYADNWKWLSKQIIADANNKCELCYAPNGQLVVRVNNRSKYPWIADDCFEISEDDKFTKIVLTVHHINGIKKDNRKQNLIALCQKCHLRLDLMKHMDNRKKKKIPYQQELKLII